MTWEKLLEPGYLMMLVGIAIYYVRSSIHTQLADKIEAVSEKLIGKIDELKCALTSLTVTIARVEEKHTSLADRVDHIDNRVADLEHKVMRGSVS